MLSRATFVCAVRCSRQGSARAGAAGARAGAGILAVLAAGARDATDGAGNQDDPNHLPESRLFSIVVMSIQARKLAGPMVTGNAQADADIIAFYKAREELMANSPKHEVCQHPQH